MYADESFANVATTDRGRGVVFWLLIGLGLTGLTPCLLLPEWRQYERLVRSEQMEARRVADLRALVDRARAEYDALRDDPAVMARLARRELHFALPEERTVPVLPAVRGQTETRVPAHLSRSTLDWVPQEALLLEPVRPPEIIASIATRLPVLDYDAVFCDDRTRTLVLALSLGLMLLAFVLFPATDREVEDRAVS